MLKLGIVTDRTDPTSQGRVCVRMMSTTTPGQNDATPFCWPIMPFAGNGYGLYCVPAVGETVFVDQVEGGDFVCFGSHWRGTAAKPSEGSATCRTFHTAGGHILSFTDSGDIVLKNGGASGTQIVLKANGDIQLDGGGTLKALVHSDLITAFNAHIHAVSGEATLAPTSQLTAATYITGKVKGS